MKKFFLIRFFLYFFFIFIIAACKKDDNNPAPVISGITPRDANAGSQISILGSGFSREISENSVKFNDIEAAILYATYNQLIVIVPKGAKTGTVTVISKGKTSQGMDFFIPEGILQKYLSDSIKINDYNYPSNAKYHFGFSFVPKADSKVTHLGFQVKSQGTYEVFLWKGESWNENVRLVAKMTSEQSLDSTWTYKSVAPVQLKKDSKYYLTLYLMKQEFMRGTAINVLPLTASNIIIQEVVIRYDPPNSSGDTYSYQTLTDKRLYGLCDLILQ